MTKLFKLTIFISGLLISGMAFAASVSSTMDVTATVVGSCSVSSTGAAFGPVSAITGGSATGTVDVNCETGTGYLVALDAGLHYIDDSVGVRFIQNGAGDPIAYIINRPASADQWGDLGVSESNTYPNGGVVSGTGTGATQQLAFDAFLVQLGGGGPDNVFTAGTSYSDTVTITVVF